MFWLKTKHYPVINRCRSLGLMCVATYNKYIKTNKKRKWKKKEQSKVQKRIRSISWRVSLHTDEHRGGFKLYQEERKTRARVNVPAANILRALIRRAWRRRRFVIRELVRERRPRDTSTLEARIEQGSARGRGMERGDRNEEEGTSREYDPSL